MKVELLARQRIYEGFFKLDRVRFRYQRFDGDMSREISHEMVDRGEGVAVLLYDPRQDTLCLIRQFRLGPLMSPANHNPWILELVAGNCDGNTDYPTVVRREIQEEAGWSVYDLRLITRFFVSPSGSSEHVHLYLGLFDSQAQQQGGGGVDAENEDIQPILFTFAEAWQQVENGGINSVGTLFALHWLAMHRDRLRAEQGPPASR